MITKTILTLAAFTVSAMLNRKRLKEMSSSILLEQMTIDRTNVRNTNRNVIKGWCLKCISFIRLVARSTIVNQFINRKRVFTLDQDV